MRQILKVEYNNVKLKTDTFNFNFDQYTIFLMSHKYLIINSTSNEYDMSLIFTKILSGLSKIIKSNIEANLLTAPKR